MALLFGFTAFLSAFLLFLIQPMIAKTILPPLGCAPAVWTTCMVFFQAALLAGYAYANAVTTTLGPRHQTVLHVGLFLLALLVLPTDLTRSWRPPAEANPIPWLLALLAVSIGLPFFMAASNTVVLQSWFANRGRPATRDPYILYAASNLGSLVALPSYPGLIEPNLRLADQRWLWTAVYGLLVALTAGCAALAWGAARASREAPVTRARQPRSGRASAIEVSGPTLRRRLCWVALAFVPSSLMLAVTTYLTAEVAAIPLLWVIPLALYLLSFVLTFGSMSSRLHSVMVLAMPVATLLLVFLTLSRVAPPIWVVMLLHLATLFVVAMVCHGALVMSRPPISHLTEFYVWIAIGGVLGGLFNAVLAPLLFSALVEYPLTLVLACLLLPRTAPAETSHRERWLDMGVAVAFGLGTVGLFLGLSAGRPDAGLGDATLGLKSGQLTRILLGLPALLCYLLVGRPIRFGLAVGAILVASALASGIRSPVLYRERSFFGIHSIRLDRDGRYVRLYHGTTVHGMQSLDPARHQEPLAYYYPTGPIGQVFQALHAQGATPPIALIGLGAGALAAYGASGQEMTFYEIDGAVERLARNARYFTHLRDADGRGVKLRIVLGDARLRLAQAPDYRYGLIVVDAFSSHAIPVHLITREAVQLYLSKLAYHGLVAFHISVPSLRLEAVLGALARDASLTGLIRYDAADEELGKAPSVWAVLARRQADLAPLAQDVRWKRLLADPVLAVWTDEFSNLLGILRWR